MEQRLIQSPQMIQAMQVLQLSSLDLEERIEQELVENPFLEVVEPGRGEDEGGDEGSERAESDADASDSGIETMIEELERYERDFGDGSRPRIASSEESDRKFEAMQNTPDRVQSLAEDLLSQLAILDLVPRERELAEFLVYSLDHHGYLPDPPEELARECDVPGVTAEELTSILRRLRALSHPALGAHDLRECLLLQLDSNGYDAPLLRKLVTDHLSDITTNRLPRIARATGHTIEEIKTAIETLGLLDPYPGEEFGDEPVTVIVPDVVVEEIDGEYEVRLTRQRFPELTVSPAYRQMLQRAEGGEGGEAVQQWVRKRLESARWFIDAIHQRQNTMLKIAKAIFRRQRGFLDKGIKALQPLRMQEIADEAGVHISTVSRAVAGKYAQTPRGIRPLKFFFTSGTATEKGGVASQLSIKQRMKELIEAEDPQSPLSDDQLAEALYERDGIRIARRTVTKYRKALSIPSSSQRKQF